MDVGKRIEELTLLYQSYLTEFLTVKSQKRKGELSLVVLHTKMHLDDLKEFSSWLSFPPAESKCCGRCDGINDLCRSDTVD